MPCTYYLSRLLPLVYFYFNCLIHFNLCPHFKTSSYSSNSFLEYSLKCNNRMDKNKPGIKMRIGILINMKRPLENILLSNTQ